MFNLQGSEIIIILLLALVVLGPEKLPEAMRKAGQFYAELRKMSAGFQSEFKAAVDEPMRELRDTANVLRDSADFTKLQDGSRTEKPQSAAMEPTSPDAVPVDEVPTFETPVSSDGPAESAESAPAPFIDSPTAQAAATVAASDVIGVDALPDSEAPRAVVPPTPFPQLEWGASVEAPEPAAPSAPPEVSAPETADTGAQPPNDLSGDAGEPRVGEPSGDDLEQ